MKIRIAALALTVVLLGGLYAPSNAGQSVDIQQLGSQNEVSLAVQGVVQIAAQPQKVNVGQNARWIASTNTSVQSAGILTITLPINIQDITYKTLEETVCTVTRGTVIDVSCVVPSTPYVVEVYGTVGFGQAIIRSQVVFRTDSEVLEAHDFQFINGIRSIFIPLLIQ